MCVCDSDFSYIVQPLDGDKRLFLRVSQCSLLLKLCISYVRNN